MLSICFFTVLRCNAICDKRIIFGGYITLDTSKSDSRVIWLLSYKIEACRLKWLVSMYFSSNNSFFVTCKNLCRRGRTVKSDGEDFLYIATLIKKVYKYQSLYSLEQICLDSRKSNNWQDFVGNSVNEQLFMTTKQNFREPRKTQKRSSKN